MEEEREVQNEAIDLDGIAEKYEEKSYFKRLCDMVYGLRQSKYSREYKEARIELQRLAAPLIAVLVPLLTAVVICVVTAISSQVRPTIQVDVPAIEDEPDVLKDIEELPPDDPEPVPMEEVEIQVDTPNPGPVTDLTPRPSPPSEQKSVKPATVDAVAMVKSPVSFKAIQGSRTPDSIGAATRGGNQYGDPTTEAAVMKVLWWLKAHQNTDGSWGQANKAANTAFAVLTYLAHGEHPGSLSPYTKDFGPVVQSAMI